MSKNVKVDFSSLEKFSKNLKKVSGTHSYKMGEILTDKFICKNTNFNTLDEFMKTCGIHNDEEFKAFPDAEMDKFVQSHSHFSSWKDMLQTASAEHLKKQLGL